MIFFCISMMLIISTFGHHCDDILCANVFDEVCGMAVLHDGTEIIKKYQNICFMKKQECELQSFMEIYQVADELCNIKKRGNQGYQLGESRRAYDSSIVGTFQVCNHTCPTYCTDIYDPACAQIWRKDKLSYTCRIMINHCHIDMYSCVSGLNVTILALTKCYKNPTLLHFMQNIAALKSMQILDRSEEKHEARSGRRTNSPQPDEDIKINLKKHLEEVFAAREHGMTSSVGGFVTN
uniref:Kazal-like domain-containing protein n=1 Tax=Heliothis virescens TaxID=7102 RepID=A0A2A4K816_HELVI